MTSLTFFVCAYCTLLFFGAGNTEKPMDMMIAILWSLFNSVAWVCFSITCIFEGGPYILHKLVFLALKGPKVCSLGHIMQVYPLMWRTRYKGLCLHGATRWACGGSSFPARQMWLYLDPLTMPHCGVDGWKDWLVCGDAHCYPSVYGTNLNEYSGSVWGVAALLLLNLSQQQSGAEEG